MIRPWATLGMMMASTTLFALDCGNLGITIENTSAHNCVLKHVLLMHGHFQDQVPLSMPSGSTSPVFYLYQDNDGVAVELDYRCDNKLVVINSSQTYCGHTAGYVKGNAYSGNDMVTEHRETMGGYWYATPGQIDWTFR